VRKYILLILQQVVHIVTIVLYNL